jgi:orotidine-5'-phosphate decarboxylase
MTRSELINQIKEKQSFLCVGLDSDLNKIPTHLLSEADPIFEFNKAIIDATAPYCVAYKPNIAFYESMGPKGWESLRKTLEYIPENCFTIADAKRGDIGNTAAQYATSFFDKQSSGLEFDSITVAPYMGEDSVSPFLEFKGKWTILLALTSNSGSRDFQLFSNGEKNLYEQVVTTSRNWGSPENLMYVVGATNGEDIGRVRKLAPRHFFLVPGVGAQGGSLEDVVQYGMNSECGLLVNSSRGIIYASSDLSFATASAEKAKAIQLTMSQHLKNHGII